MTLDEPWLADRVDDLKASVQFLTRLPLSPTMPSAGADLARAAWAFPVAGIVVGLIGGVVYGLAHHLGVPPWPRAALAVAATLLVTGCLHEDGLADTADGFGGGKTREQKLDIMRDSRIGTYGVCALIFAILLRVAALASLAAAGSVVPVLIAAHAAARGAMPVLMYIVPPARRDGLAFSAGRPPVESAAAAGLLAIVILMIGLGPWHALVAVILLAAAIALTAWLTTAQIDGQTGDVIGALEQVSEIIILLVAVS